MRSPLNKAPFTIYVILFPFTIYVARGYICASKQKIFVANKMFLKYNKSLLQFCGFKSPHLHTTNRMVMRFFYFPFTISFTAFTKNPPTEKAGGFLLCRCGVKIPSS